MATWTAFHSYNTCGLVVKAVKCWPSDKLSYILMITINCEGMQHNISAFTRTKGAALKVASYSCSNNESYIQKTTVLVIIN